MGTPSSTPADRIAHVLFGSTRRDVLALLMGRPDESFYLREILRTIGGGSGAVQRELKQLADAGLIRRETRGNQVYFSANRDAPIFADLRAIVEKTAGTADVLRTSLSKLVRDRRIELAFVYGSVASGKQTARSDVDLLVIGDATLSEVVPALEGADRRLGREINASVYPSKEFRQKLKRGTPFLRRIVAGPKLFVAGDARELERLAR
jgi:predicted nucleotidyltransferase